MARVERKYRVIENNGDNTPKTFEVIKSNHHVSWGNNYTDETQLAPLDTDSLLNIQETTWCPIMLPDNYTKDETENKLVKAAWYTTGYSSVDEQGIQLVDGVLGRVYPSNEKIELEIEVKLRSTIYTGSYLYCWLEQKENTTNDTNLYYKIKVKPDTYFTSYTMPKVEDVFNLKTLSSYKSSYIEDEQYYKIYISELTDTSKGLPSINMTNECGWHISNKEGWDLTKSFDENTSIEIIPIIDSVDYYVNGTKVFNEVKYFLHSTANVNCPFTYKLYTKANISKEIEDSTYENHSHYKFESKECLHFTTQKSIDTESVKTDVGILYHKDEHTIYYQCIDFPYTCNNGIIRKKSDGLLDFQRYMTITFIEGEDLKKLVDKHAAGDDWIFTITNNTYKCYENDDFSSSITVATENYFKLTGHTYTGSYTFNINETSNIDTISISYSYFTPMSRKVYFHYTSLTNYDEFTKITSDLGTTTQTYDYTEERLVTAGEKIPTLTRDGYNFLGWTPITLNVDSEGDNSYFTTDNIRCMKTNVFLNTDVFDFYAIWKDTFTQYTINAVSPIENKVYSYTDNSKKSGEYINASVLQTQEDIPNVLVYEYPDNKFAFDIVPKNIYDIQTEVKYDIREVEFYNTGDISHSGLNFPKLWGLTTYNWKYNGKKYGASCTEDKKVSEDSITWSKEWTQLKWENLTFDRIKIEEQDDEDHNKTVDNFYFYKWINENDKCTLYLGHTDIDSTKPTHFKVYNFYHMYDYFTIKAYNFISTTYSNEFNVTYKYNNTEYEEEQLPSKYTYIINRNETTHYYSPLDSRINIYTNKVYTYKLSSLIRTDTNVEKSVGLRLLGDDIYNYYTAGYDSEYTYSQAYTNEVDNTNPISITMLNIESSKNAWVYTLTDSTD